MRRDYRRITVLVHGWWGSGKSWFAASTPGPRLVIDTEGGFHDTPGEHLVVQANRLATTDLSGITKDVSVIVDIQSWQDVEFVRDVLRKGEHPFESVIIDSLNELQDQLKRAVQAIGSAYNPNEVYDFQAWGRLLNNMSLFMRELRDLARPTSVKPVNVVLVSGTDDEKLPHKPLLEGGVRKQIAGWFDVVGYMTVAQDQDQNEVRVLGIESSPIHVAKCRLHNLKVKHGSEIINPDVKRMLAVVNPKESK